MPFVSPSTVVTQTTITTAWGNSVKAAVDFLANPPSCRVRRTTNQSVADSTATAISFDAERYDTDTMWIVGAPTRVTFTTAGLYIVTGHLVFSARSDYAAVAAQLRIGGTTFIASQSGTGNAAVNVFQHLQVSTVYKFAAAEYVELMAFQDNAANAATNAESAPNYGLELAATWIGTG